MFYDPGLKPADPYERETLVAWLRQQNPAEEYVYISQCGCLLARYFSEKLGRPLSVTQSFVYEGTDPNAVPKPRIADLPPGFDAIAREGESTFGAALRRATA